MARSEYVYVVMDTGEFPLAAFTVKKEMVRYLKRQADPHSLRVYRMRDGELDRRPRCAEISMRELLGKEVEWHTDGR